MIREHDGGLSAQELRTFSRPNPRQTWGRIAAIWLGIGGLFAAAILTRGWALPVLIVLMARQQMALGALMHEGAHRRLFASHTWNDHVSQLFLGGPLLLIADGYRRMHLRHHREPLSPNDPDIGITGGYPISRQRLRTRLWRDISGQTWVKFVRHFVFPHKRTKAVASAVLDTPRRRDGVPLSNALAGMLAVHGTLLVSVWLAGWPSLYLWLWLLPQMTVLQVFLRIRGITEHAGFQPQADQRLNTRTVLDPWVAWFVAPGALNFHITHHLYPSVPWFQVPHVHRLLRDRGALDGAPVYQTYGEVLRELTAG